MTIYPAHFFTTDYPPHDPARRATIDMADDDTPTNGERADDAAGRLPFYYRHTDDESLFADLITNLLHLAHSRELDPADIITSALNNFRAEAGPIPTAPNGWQTVDTSTEETAPAPPLYWYAITGRIPGDDEDSCNIYHCATADEATDAFESEMLEGHDIEAIKNSWDGTTCIINHVLRSATEIA